MSVNLISSIMQALPSDAIRKIAFALGTDHTATQQAITVAVPSVLGGLANMTSSPDGAQKVNNAVREADPNFLSDFMHRISESGDKSMIETGVGMLSSMLGRGATDTLGSIIAQYSGFGQGSAKKLLGFIAPLVLGMLRKEQVSSGLDAKGLAKLLDDQRGNIKAALPAGVLQQLQDSRPAETATTTRTYRTATNYEKPETRDSGSWLYWLIPALALAGLAFYLIPRLETPKNETRSATENVKPNPVETTREDTHPAPQPTQATNTEAQPTPTPVTATTTVGKDMMSNIDKLSASLQGIKDGPSAKAALPALRDIGDRISKLKVSMQQLSPDERKSLIASLSARMPDLNTLLDRVSQESAADTKPAIDTLKSQLDGLVKA